MNCLPCFTSKKSEEVPETVPVAQVADTTAIATATPPTVNNPPNQPAAAGNESNTAENTGSRTFTFRELAMATKNFKQECLIGEGGFGKLYKGKLQTGEVVAVKQLDRNGTQGNKEFLVEVLILTLLNHPNLVKLIGYCADGDQRLLVYEYLPFGSLDVHLHDISADKKPLDWQTRMRTASGVAQGLAYLHEKANPPILYHNLKPANILLSEDFHPRLSGYGLAKLSNGDTKMHASPRVMGTYGYCAPEYERQGELTMKSDVYSFGVILLELITGRRALDTTRPTEEQNLVSWAQPMFRDQKRFPDLADPLLQGRFSQKGLNQAVGVAAMCLQEEPSVRPLMGDVVSILNFLEVEPPEDGTIHALAPAAPSASETNGHESEGDGLSSDDESDDTSVSSENSIGDHAKNQNEYTEHLDRDQSHKSGGSSRNSKNGWPDGIAQQNSKSNASSAAPQGHVSINLRHDSIEELQDGSISSSIENERYEDSFAWSIGSSSNYQLRDGSTRQNSGQISNMDFHKDSLGLSMRQQSIPNT